MMEDGNGRRKIWICLLIVVLAAIAIGVVYDRLVPKETVEEGFLIQRERGGSYDGIRENLVY